MKELFETKLKELHNMSSEDIVSLRLAMLAYEYIDFYDEDYEDGDDENPFKGLDKFKLTCRIDDAIDDAGISEDTWQLIHQIAEEMRNENEASN